MELIERSIADLKSIREASDLMSDRAMLELKLARVEGELRRAKELLEQEPVAPADPNEAFAALEAAAQETPDAVPD